MPNKFIYHDFNNNPDLTKIQLLPNDIFSFIYVDINKFEDYFYGKILNLYNKIYSNSHINFLLLPEEMRNSYVHSLDFWAIEEISEYIRNVEIVLDSITNDLFSIVIHINANKAILQNINSYITPLDALILYISICLTVIDNDQQDFSSKYIKGINYSFSRLISNILTLWESKNNIRDILSENNSNDDDDNRDEFFKEVCSVYSEYSAIATEVDGKVIISTKRKI